MSAEPKAGQTDEALQNARYVGKRYPIQSPQGKEIEMHVISVDHPNGRWEAIYCQTEAQARAIEVICAKLAEAERRIAELEAELAQTTRAYLRDKGYEVPEP